MSQLIHLSLLLAVSQQSSASIIREFPNEGIKLNSRELCAAGGIITHNCTAGKWIWTFKCCEPSGYQVTLQATALSYNMTVDSPNMCPKITYKTQSFFLSLEVEHGCIMYSGGNQICGTCYSTPITNAVNAKRISALIKDNIRISIPEPDRKTVRIHYKNVHQKHHLSGCIDDYTGLNQRHHVTTESTGTYLQFYQEAKSWIDALEHCQREYSSLAEITNQTVKDEVENLLQNKTGLREGVWVGLERSIFGKHKEWMWTSGSKNINLQWNSSMQHFNNHCAKIISAELQEIKLLDANCHDKLPYICQEFEEEAE